MPRILQPSVTHDGTTVTTYDSTTAPLVEYQTVTAHGNAAVSDATKTTVITYNQGVAVLSPDSYESDTKPGMVHLPMATPPATTRKTKLQDVIVKFTTDNDAVIKNLYVYYGTKQVFSANPNKSSAFYVSAETSEQEAALYDHSNPTGICVSLDLGFPSADADINLEAVTLVYLNKD